MIRLIVGLGNPGRDYVDTRHNAGFWAIDTLAKKFDVTCALEQKYHAEVARIKLGSYDVYLLKPQTYMNLSGKSVQSFASFFKISPEEILVIHDELDFAPGIIKLKQAGGNGGHNGLKDIDRAIGKNYWRLRVGIGHPGHANKVVGFVLNRPTLDEKFAIELALTKFITVSEDIILGNFAHAQRQLHTLD